MTDDGSYLYFTNGGGYYGEYSYLRRMSLATGAISTMTQRSIYSAYTGLVIGPDGALYGASGNTVDRIDTTNNTVTTIVTFQSPSPGYLNTTLVSLTADSSYLWLSVYDRDSYYGQEYNPRVVRVDLATGARHSFPVGTGQTRYTQLTSAGDYLYGVTGYRVVRVTKATGETVVIAGQPGTEPGYANGTGADAWFGTLQALASDGTRLYVVDQTNTRIRALS